MRTRKTKEIHLLRLSALLCAGRLSMVCCCVQVLISLCQYSTLFVAVNPQNRIHLHRCLLSFELIPINHGFYALGLLHLLHLHIIQSSCPTCELETTDRPTEKTDL